MFAAIRPFFSLARKMHGLFWWLFPPTYRFADTAFLRELLSWLRLFTIVCAGIIVAAILLKSSTRRRELLRKLGLGSCLLCAAFIMGALFYTGGVFITGCSGPTELEWQRATALYLAGVVEIGLAIAAEMILIAFVYVVMAIARYLRTLPPKTDGKLDGWAGRDTDQR